MNDTVDPALAARARTAFEQSIGENSSSEPPDPETLAGLERGVAALPRRTREIFLAHRIDMYGYGKIASLTGLSQRSVERHVAKAICHLSRYADGDERTPWQRWWQTHWLRWLR